MNRQAVQKRKLPDAPGVYFFLKTRMSADRDADGCGLLKKEDVLYIGRATSLRDRVRSYFDGRLLETRGAWLAKMLPRIRGIDFHKTDSVLEAVLLEAELIKKFQPPYNTDEKDDKSFNCVVITREPFPAVFIERSRNIDFAVSKLRTSNLKLLTVHGPFSHGFDLHIALKLIRRIFPYRDLKCSPLIPPFLKEGASLRAGGFQNPSPAKKPVLPFTKGEFKAGKPCFNRQIGLCPGVCTGEISRNEYAKTIRNIRLFFEGKKARLLKLLEKEMKAAALRQEFERAGELKRQLFALRHIQDIALMRRSILPESHSYIRTNVGMTRIEAYDVSHFGGKEIVGAFAVVEDGAARPSEYRLFKIRGIQSAHETKGLQEIIRRRFGHPEWPFPSLIVVDGNEVQKKAAEAVLAERGLHISVVAVVKDEHHRPRKILGRSVLKIEDEGLRIGILLANSEAHRFVLKFQRKRRAQHLLA